MKIGILVNPSAGNGKSAENVISRIEETWSGHELYAIDGPSSACFEKAVLLPQPHGGYVEKLFLSVDALVSAGSELIVTLGGDGTAAYVAQALHDSGKCVPLLGIGLGTANVGPIVTLGAEDPFPSVEDLCYEPVSAVAVFTGGRRIAAGYNDVVFGNTYLATVDGQIVTADGHALLEKGQVCPAKPLADIFTETTRIMKNGKLLPHSLPHVGQAVSAPIDRDALYGRTIHGVFICAPYSSCQGALTLSALPLVSFEEDERGFEAFAPEERLLFSPDDRITITGLAPSVLAVCDGNPWPITEGSVTLQYVPQDALIAKRR